MVPGTGAAEDYEGLDVTGKIAVVQRAVRIMKSRPECGCRRCGGIDCLQQPAGDGLHVHVGLEHSRSSFPRRMGPIWPSRRIRFLTIAAKDALVTSPVQGMSDFSSWGATSELTLKPELSAPGGNIYSAIPGKSV